MTRTSIWIAAIVAVAGMALTACGGDADPCDRTVSPSDDDRFTVQTMFEEAQAGETLCFSPGTYSFDDGVTISDLDGITLRGTGADRDEVVLDFFPMGTGNSGLNISGMTRFTIENVRVLDAAQNNVFITDSTDVIVRNVSSGWVQRPPESAGKYAIYPVLSQRVLIEDSEAFGSADAGLYVGQTQDCVVRNNLAYDNVAGIEIENSSRCEVYGNEAYDNTAGILVFELPGIERHGGSTLVHDNIARDNNLPNFARDGIVARVPAGIGVMILAANQVEVRDNTITGNDSSGIVVVSFQTVVILGEEDPTASDPDYDMFAEDIWLHDNTTSDNGQMPDGALALIGAQATHLLRSERCRSDVRPPSCSRRSPWCSGAAATATRAPAARATSRSGGSSSRARTSPCPTWCRTSSSRRSSRTTRASTASSGCPRASRSASSTVAGTSRSRR